MPRIARDLKYKADPSAFFAARRGTTWESEQMDRASLSNASSTHHDIREELQAEAAHRGSPGHLACPPGYVWSGWDCQRPSFVAKAPPTTYMGSTTAGRADTTTLLLGVVAVGALAYFLIPR